MGEEVFELGVTGDAGLLWCGKHLRCGMHAILASGRIALSDKCVYRY